MKSHVEIYVGTRSKSLWRILDSTSPGILRSSLGIGSPRFRVDIEMFLASFKVQTCRNYGRSVLSQASESVVRGPSKGLRVEASTMKTCQISTICLSRSSSPIETKLPRKTGSKSESIEQSYASRQYLILLLVF